MEDKINPWTCKKKKKRKEIYRYMSHEVIYLYRILFHDQNGKIPNETSMRKAC